MTKYQEFYKKALNFLTEQTSLTDLSCDENLLVLIAMYELEDSDIDDIESAVNDCIQVYQTTPDNVSFSKICYAYDMWYHNREEDTREFKDAWRIYYIALED